eukprot:271786_1
MSHTMAEAPNTSSLAIDSLPVKSLEELYQRLENEEGFSTFKQWCTYHEYDFDCVVDDVNDNHSDIKTIVSVALFRNIQVCINGQYQHNTTNNMGIIEHALSNLLQKGTMNEKETTNVITAFKSVVEEEKFTFEDIRSDVEEYDDSKIVGYLQFYVHEETELRAIHLILQFLTCNTRPFEIKSFDWNINGDDLKRAEERMPSLYLNVLRPSTHPSLFVAKAVDHKNFKPIVYWLLQEYLSDRASVAKYKLHSQKSGFKRWKHQYSMMDHWKRNKYCQYIERTYGKTARFVQSALTQICKQVIIPMVYPDYRSSSFIWDDMTVYVKYAIAFHNLALRINRSLAQCRIMAPIHLDYWIVPRQVLSDRNRFTLEGDIKSMISQLGYIEGDDYITMQVDHTSCIYIQLRILSQRVMAFIHNRSAVPFASQEFTVIIDRRDSNCGDTAYIIKVIKPTRYHTKYGEPLCVCGAKLTHVEGHHIKHANGKCIWCGVLIKSCDTKEILQCSKHKDDGYYLCSDKCKDARAATYSQLPSNWEQCPELCWYLSMTNPLFAPKFDFTVDNIIGFSYHILKWNDVSAFVYKNGVSTFLLSDIQWLWPHWFREINGKPQQVHASIFDDAHCKVLPNSDFVEFAYQIDALGDITLDNHNLCEESDEFKMTAYSIEPLSGTESTDDWPSGAESDSNFIISRYASEAKDDQNHKALGSGGKGSFPDRDDDKEENHPPNERNSVPNERGNGSSNGSCNGGPPKETCTIDDHQTLEQTITHLRSILLQKDFHIEQLQSALGIQHTLTQSNYIIGHLQGTITAGSNFGTTKTSKPNAFSDSDKRKKHRPKRPKSNKYSQNKRYVTAGNKSTQSHLKINESEVSFIKDWILNEPWYKKKNVTVFGQQYTIRNVVLKLTKTEFIKQCEEYLNGKAKDDINLIPIRRWDDGIEHVFVVPIDKQIDADIGVSFRYHDGQKVVSVTGYHLQLHKLRKLHKNASHCIEKKCHCLDSFTSKITELEILV